MRNTKKIKCWKYNKWSYHYPKCLWCETSKKSWNTRHKGNGLCIKCFDEKRKQNPKRQEQLKNQGRKWYLKNGNTPEEKKRRYESVIKYQKTPAFKRKLKTQIYQRRRLIYFIRSNKKYNIKSWDGLEIIIDGQKVKTPLKTSGVIANEIELFKKLYKKYHKV